MNHHLVKISLNKSCWSGYISLFNGHVTSYDYLIKLLCWWWPVKPGSNKSCGSRGITYFNMWALCPKVKESRCDHLRAKCGNSISYVCFFDILRITKCDKINYYKVVRVTDWGFIQTMNHRPFTFHQLTRRLFTHQLTLK